MTEKANLDKVVKQLLHTPISVVVRLAPALEEGKSEEDSAELVELDLDGREIGDEEMKVLCVALGKNKTLHTLDLNSNNFSAEGAKTLTQALGANETLDSLDLSYNSIGEEGAMIISKAIATNHSLVDVNMEYTQIKDEGAKAIAEALKTNKTLARLNLRDNEIGEDGGEALGTALSHNDALTEIRLGMNKIGNKGIGAFAAALKDNKALTSLQLNDNQIGDEGCSELSKALASNKTLTKLDLGGNLISHEGLKDIVDALRHNKSLGVLKLHSNKIDNVGAKVMADLLRTNTSLTKLDLWDNKFGSEGHKALLNALGQNNSLIFLGLPDERITKQVESLFEKYRAVNQIGTKSLFDPQFLNRLNFQFPNLSTLNQVKRYMAFLPHLKAYGLSDVVLLYILKFVIFPELNPKHERPFPLVVKDDHQKGAEVKVSLPNGKEKRIPEVTFRKHYTHVYKKLLSLPTGLAAVVDRKFICGSSIILSDKIFIALFDFVDLIEKNHLPPLEQAGKLLKLSEFVTRWIEDFELAEVLQLAECARLIGCEWLFVLACREFRARFVRLERGDLGRLSRFCKEHRTAWRPVREESSSTSGIGGFGDLNVGRYDIIIIASAFVVLLALLFMYR